MGKASARQDGLGVSVIPRRFPGRAGLGRMQTAQRAHRHAGWTAGGIRL